MLSVNQVTFFDDIFFNGKTVEVVLWNGDIVWKKQFRLGVTPTAVTIPASGGTVNISILSNMEWKIE